MLVDANVFKGFFQTEIGKGHSLCGCPRALMAHVSKARPMYHDEGGVVESEWRNVVDRDWFEAWLADSLLSGMVEYCAAPKNIAVEKKMATKGFPGGRDSVYIRVALTVAAGEGSCTFYTEDLDFFDPKMKGQASSTRIRTIRNNRGPIQNILAKYDIVVSCVPGASEWG